MYEYTTQENINVPVAHIKTNLSIRPRGNERQHAEENKFAPYILLVPCALGQAVAWRRRSKCQRRLPPLPLRPDRRSTSTTPLVRSATIMSTTPDPGVVALLFQRDRTATDAAAAARAKPSGAGNM
jgi:hypothetical protein